MLPKLTIPAPQPPKPLPGYDLPASHERLLTWAFVVEQMTASDFYWLASTYPDGRPHTVPLWGVWFEDRLHVDGGPQTRWARNLFANPKVSVHVPSAEQVVIIEGTARDLDDPDLDAATWKRLDTLFQRKYKVEEGSPYWVIEPRLVLAWDGPTLETMTRWVFG